jgi:hypothetical protein
MDDDPFDVAPTRMRMDYWRFVAWVHRTLEQQTDKPVSIADAIKRTNAMLRSVMQEAAEAQTVSERRSSIAKRCSVLGAARLCRRCFQEEILERAGCAPA